MNKKIIALLMVALSATAGGSVYLAARTEQQRSQELTIEELTVVGHIWASDLTCIDLEVENTGDLAVEMSQTRVNAQETESNVTSTPLQPGDSVAVRVTPRTIHIINYPLVEPPTFCSGDMYVFTIETVTGKMFHYVATAPYSCMHAEINIDPDTLNLRSNGKWVTTYLTPPEGYLVEDIDVTTVEMIHNDFILTCEWSSIQDNVLMVKFDRIALRDYLEEADLDYVDKFYDLTLTVTGELTDGIEFKGTDTITVIKR